MHHPFEVEGYELQPIYQQMTDIPQLVADNPIDQVNLQIPEK